MTDYIRSGKSSKKNTDYSYVDHITSLYSSSQAQKKRDSTEKVRENASSSSSVRNQKKSSIFHLPEKRPTKDARQSLTELLCHFGGRSVEDVLLESLTSGVDERQSLSFSARSVLRMVLTWRAAIDQVIEQKNVKISRENEERLKKLGIFLSDFSISMNRMTQSKLTATLNQIE